MIDGHSPTPASSLDNTRISVEMWSITREKCPNQKIIQINVSVSQAASHTTIASRSLCTPAEKRDFEMHYNPHIEWRFWHELESEKSANVYLITYTSRGFLSVRWFCGAKSSFFSLTFRSEAQQAYSISCKYLGEEERRKKTVEASASRTRNKAPRGFKFILTHDQWYNCIKILL